MVEDKNTVCKLCLKQSILRNSHILPEFLYDDVYDKLHRTMLISSSDKERLIQKGIREYLLCQECETKLSQYEGYARNIIKNIDVFQKDTSGAFLFSDSVDYKLFKLFQLSILWRSSISKSQMFANVNLRKHEEIVRKLIYDENPGKTEDYGCYIVRIPNPQKIDRIIMPPIAERHYGHNGYVFMIGNMFWYFIVSSHAVPESVKTLFLQETSILRIWDAPYSEQEVYGKIKELFRSRK